MKLLPLLLAVVACAAANRYTDSESREREEYRRSEWFESKLESRLREIKDKEIRADSEYKYFYDGQLATGIPQSSKQHAATRIQSVVAIQCESSTKCVLKMEHVRFGKLNEHEISEPQRIKPFELFEEVEIESELKTVLQRSVEFTYERGMIKNIEFDGEEQPWSANIKRGVLNMLQVNLHKEHERRSIEDESLRSELENKKRQSFITMEKSIEGECKTLYNFESTPCRETSERKCREPTLESSRVLNVTKTIDFEHCIQRPDVRYNERFEEICPSCQNRYNKTERSLRSSSISKFSLICESVEESKCLIEKSEVDSQYNMIVFDEESSMITTYVRQTLRLMKTSKISERIEKPKNKQPSDSEMMYSLDWDVRKERFFKEGDREFEEKTPFSKMSNKVEFVKSIIESWCVKCTRRFRRRHPVSWPVSFELCACSRQANWTRSTTSTSAISHSRSQRRRLKKSRA